MSPVGILIVAVLIAYLVLSAARRNFMKGQNASKKQTDVGLLIVLTTVIWTLVRRGM